VSLYVVSVENPTPAWVHWNPGNHLPCFTFQQPAGMELPEAKALKARAAICCGGTLRIVEADA